MALDVLFYHVAFLDISRFYRGVGVGVLMTQWAARKLIYIGFHCIYIHGRLSHAYPHMTVVSVLYIVVYSLS